MTLQKRMAALIDEAGTNNNKVAKATGIGRGTIGEWVNGAVKTISSENLIKVSNYFDVNPTWLATGKGPRSTKEYKSTVLITDTHGQESVLIPEFSEVRFEGGTGAENNAYNEPTQALTFRKDWIESKGYDVDKLIGVYATGTSMAPRIQPGDLLLVRTDRQHAFIDGRVYALNYNGQAKIKRVYRDATDAVHLVSDNKMTSELPETIPPSMLDSLNVIGEVVWIGGDME